MNIARLTILAVAKKIKVWLTTVASFFRLTGYLFKASQDSELHPILRSYLGDIPLCCFSEPILWLRMLLASNSRFQKSEQRPYAFYSPHLTALPFGKSDPISTYLEDNFEYICAEFAQVAPPKFLLLLKL